MDTVTLTIDGTSVTVEKGRTVLHAAIEAGIPLPYYCYHPGLGVDGSCRVCIVKIERIPKLQTSCSTPCADGMVVSTRDPEVVEARASVFEFLLVNHPLDCPVCDKGGECPLQDYSYSFGPAQSRMDFPRRVFDGEGVRADVDFGPTLMLNRNRCILCTRCSRFMREVDGDAQIGITDRGSGSQISTFEEQGVHSLLSGNLVDVCPVGAITARDYRFKSRPWDNPGVADTICTRCSKGCSVNVWTRAKPEWARGSRLVRITPRFNADVNGYWMCDIGRFDYHWLEGERRLRVPMTRSADGTLGAVSWPVATARLAEHLGSAAQPGVAPIRFLVSAHAASEELFVLQETARGLFGAAGLEAVTVSWTRSPKLQPPGTTFSVPATDAPNVNGARELGYHVGAGNETLPDMSGLRTSVEAGHVRALYVIDSGPAGSLGDVAWIVAARRAGTLPLLVVQAVELTDLATAADIVLPGAACVEKDGVYVNDQGRVQAAPQVYGLAGEAREDWQILRDLAGILGLALPYESSADVRRAMAAALPHTVYAGVDRVAFTRPDSGGPGLRASNPSERQKWDVLFQDLAPVKGHSVQTEGGLVEGRLIPLKPVG